MNSDLPGAFTAQPANTEVMLFQMIEIDAFSLDQRQPNKSAFNRTSVELKPGDAFDAALVVPPSFNRTSVELKREDVLLCH